MKTLGGQRKTHYNRGLAKGGLMCFVETFVHGLTVVLRMNGSAKKPALRQALYVSINVKDTKS